jgi:hypothetical protein
VRADYPDGVEGVAINGFFARMLSVCVMISSLVVENFLA